MDNYVLFALLATLGTWLLTALGALTVAFFKAPNTKLLNVTLGFASGVMIAASFWSLLLPALEGAQELGKSPFIILTTGFLFGALFMFCTDKAVCFAQRKIKLPIKNKKTNKLIMLILSITLHNIPEGFAVGVAFGALSFMPYSAEAILSAVSVAVGIGIQNFPEGAAVSLPLRREGVSRSKSFLLGQATAIVEPFAAVVGALMVTKIMGILPFALSFAAGAMVLVAVHELIPECQKTQAEKPYLATMGIILGFCSMMLLDVALG